MRKIFPQIFALFINNIALNLSFITKIFSITLSLDDQQTKSTSDL